VKPFKLPAQFLKMVAWRNAQVLICGRVVNHLKLAEEPAFEIGWDVPRTDIL
jgi:hypothetical protein